MSESDTIKYSYGDLDRRGKFFGLHLPQLPAPAAYSGVVIPQRLRPRPPS